MIVRRSYQFARSLVGDAKTVLGSWAGHMPIQAVRHALYRRVFGVRIGVGSVVYHACQFFEFGGCFKS